MTIVLSAMRGEIGWEIVLKDLPGIRPKEKDELGYVYHDQEQRYFGHEIAQLVKEKPVRKKMPEGKR